jgi:hypothetical protein
LTGPDADLGWVIDEAPFHALRSRMIAAGIKPEEVKPVLIECLRGFAHSALVTLDGGSAMASTGRVWVKDAKNKPIGDDLHELFLSYLADRKRSKRS